MLHADVHLFIAFLNNSLLSTFLLYLYSFYSFLGCIFFATSAFNWFLINLMVVLFDFLGLI